MLELMLLVMALMGTWEMAKRRGLKGWVFVILALAGWWFTPTLVFTAMGVDSAEGMVAAWPVLYSGWLTVGLVFASTFVFGGGLRMRKGTWQCPDCLSYNATSTLVCLCGHNPDRAEADAG